MLEAPLTGSCSASVSEAHPAPPPRGAHAHGPPAVWCEWPQTLERACARVRARARPRPSPRARPRRRWLARAHQFARDNARYLLLASLLGLALGALSVL
jgi:hypothetical protein